MWRFHQYVFTHTFPPKTLHVIVIINEYPLEIHMTTIPRAWSWDTLSNIPPKRVADHKKKQFVWTDDEAELLLGVTHDYKAKHLKEGTCTPDLPSLTHLVWDSRILRKSHALTHGCSNFTLAAASRMCMQIIAYTSCRILIIYIEGVEFSQWATHKRQLRQCSP